MKILYKNKTVLSKKNYMNLVEFHQKKNNWKYWLYTFYISALLVIIVSFLIASGFIFQSLFLLICFIVFLIYRFIYPYYKTSKELHSDKIQKNLVNYYFFYEKYFKVKNKLGDSKINYTKLYRVYENENYFYLYFDKDNAFIVEKSGFLIGDVESFENFIKNKVWIKFKKD